MGDQILARHNKPPSWAVFYLGEMICQSALTPDTFRKLYGCLNGGNKMNKILSWTLKTFTVAILLILTATVANADDLSGHISGFIGGKKMMSSDWPDLDMHFSMGVFFDIKKDSWPISIVLDLTDTGGKNKHDGLEDLGHTTEYHLGIRKIFVNRDSDIQPYFGGGVSFIYAEQELETITTTTTQDDRGVGSWVGAGMYYEINPRFVLGFDVRYSHGEVTLFDKELNGGGIHAGMTVGYQF
jgi:opacity protein-like surface antigen